MSKLTDMRDKRAKAWEAAKAFLESHRGENGTLSAEDDAAYNRMDAEIDGYTKEIARLEKIEARDDEFSKAVTTPITGRPGGEDKKKTGRASDEYREDFSNTLRGRPALHNVLSTSPDADGGYLVSSEFESQIVSGLAEANVVRSVAKVITTSAERKIPIAATHSAAQWTAENGAYVESQPKFAQKTIDAYKLTDLVKVSIELLQDSAYDLEGYLAQEFARAFGAKEEQAFCVGTGDGQPTGIFVASGGGTVGVTASSASAIAADNLIDLVYSLGSAYRKNAKFLMNDATVASVRKLKDANGAYMWQPSVQAGQPDRLLGYELHTSPYAPVAAANALAAAFGDFNNYWIADRSGRTVQKLVELYAGNGQIGYIATERVDGKVILDEGIKLLKMGA